MKTLNLAYKLRLFAPLKTLKIGMIFLLSGVLMSCGKDDDPPLPVSKDPVASFQFKIDATNFLKVAFTNFSTDVTSYSWDFGDKSPANTEKDPVYTYKAPGTYTVKLTVTNAAIPGSPEKVTEKSETITLTDPQAALRAFFGADGKTWHLLADVSAGLFPLQVGPQDRSAVWWALGSGNKLCTRKCLFNDTWTLRPDGKYVYDNKGDFWAEEGIWPVDMHEKCFDTTVPGNWTGKDGQDLSGWNSGTYDYAIDPVNMKVTVTGGFIGIPKAGTDSQVTEPQASVTYDIKKFLPSAASDVVVLGTTYNNADGVPSYWESTLVSYKNASDVITIDECPVASGIETINIDFESNPPMWDVFGGVSNAGVVYTTVANPVSGGINTSGMVGLLVEPDMAEGWSGIKTTLSGKVDFTNKQNIKIKVYSPSAGEVIKLKLEDSTDDSNSKEIDIMTTAVNTWEELTYTFEVADSNKWDVLVLFFDFKTALKSGERTHYFDDIVLF